MKRKTPESLVLNSILDYFAAERVLAFRMNTGAVKTENRFFKFGVPGMADILAFPAGMWRKLSQHPVLWVECKAAGGKQSEFQKSFQRQVEEAGHVYIVARSVDEVISWAKDNLP